jgi:AcrR family transcriptional regulator
MRAVAERLQVAPNALYSHVGGKGELADALLDDLLAQVAVPSPPVTDPIAEIHALMNAVHDVLLAHPQLVPLYLARQGSRGPAAQRLGDIVLTRLASANVRDEHAQEALHTLVVYTIGSAAFATSPLTASDDQPRPPGPDPRLAFNHGLRWLLTGIAGPRRPPRTRHDDPAT